MAICTVESGQSSVKKMKAETVDGTQVRMIGIQFDFSCGLPN
jgi:hypothetical protein